jgi:hypothetical protein
MQDGLYVHIDMVSSMRMLSFLGFQDSKLGVLGFPNFHEGSSYTPTYQETLGKHAHTPTQRP